MPSVVSSRRQTTLALQPTDVTRKWYVVDATDVPMGRLAAQAALILMGKHRPEYTPHTDTGEYVIVINANKIAISGRKAEQNSRMWYTSYPGGHKHESYGSLRERRPDVLVEDAVRRMLPKNRLSRMMLKKLKVFSGPEHAFAAHNPVKLTVL
jgi:large subunit ribosomal protein L13